jgi:hypothetical protein
MARGDVDGMIGYATDQRGFNSSVTVLQLAEVH